MRRVGSQIPWLQSEDLSHRTVSTAHISAGNTILTSPSGPRHADGLPNVHASSKGPNSRVEFRSKTAIFIGFRGRLVLFAVVAPGTSGEPPATALEDPSRPQRTREPGVRRSQVPGRVCGIPKRNPSTSRRSDAASAPRTRRHTAYTPGNASRPPDSPNSTFENRPKRDRPAATFARRANRPGNAP